MKNILNNATKPEETLSASAEILNDVLFSFGNPEIENLVETAILKTVEDIRNDFTPSFMILRLSEPGKAVRIAAKDCRFYGITPTLYEKVQVKRKLEAFIIEAAQMEIAKYNSI